MIDQEYIMLILNCAKYANKAEFQRRTWLPKIPEFITYYHVIGDPTLESDFIFNHDTHMLYVKVEDDYNSLPKKVVRAFNAVNATFRFKYLFKTDDDQILVKPAFFNIIRELLTKNRLHYGGFIIDVQKPYLSQYYIIHPELPKYLPIYATKYCSGRFYFLSNAATKDIINKQEHVEREYLEDYAIGFYLHPHFKSNMININTHTFFTDIERSDFQTWIDNGIM